MSRVKKAILSALVALVSLLGTSPVWGFELLYRYGLSKRGSIPSPPVTTLSAREVDVLWAVEEGASSVRFRWAGNLFDRQPPRDGVWEVARIAPGDAERGRHPGRGLTEAAYAVWLSRHASRAELAAALAEWTCFGRGAFGLEQAADVYFGKSSSALSIAELALLVGLPQSPGAYDPACHPESARKRRAYALKRLEAAGVIDAIARAAAVREPIAVLPTCRAPSPREIDESEEP